ncbi:MAG: hypothetical protein M3N48_10225 [Verrucomicrobiota bacterium]|nr:hypothetical protein [Verrucomicrobiota bacterium]
MADQNYSVPSGPPPVGLAKGNRSRKWVLGCVATLFVIVAVVLAATYFFVNKISRAVEAREKSYFTAAPGTQIFVSASDTTPAELKNRFVPFAFHYPNSFKVVADKNAFIRLERQEHGETVAHFAVGPLVLRSSTGELGTLYPPLMKEMSELLATTFPGYRELSQKPADFKSPHFYRDGWEMRWQAAANQTVPGKAIVYGRVLFLRESSTTRAVTVTMTVAASDPEVTSAADVGEKGDLALMLQSFRLLSDKVSSASQGTQARRTRTGRNF